MNRDELHTWVYRGHISAPIEGCYDLAEILDWSEHRSHRHAYAARHQRNTTRQSKGGE